MKKLILITVALALGASLASAQPATNAPPNRMSYQGYLVDANGNPLAPSTPINYPVTFRIFTAATAGQRVWSESQTVTVDKGNFSVVLGEGNAVPGESSPALSEVIANRSDASDRFIGITVTINSVATDILPRLRLLPTPYAFLATSARNLTAPNGSSVVTYTNNRVEIAGGVQSSGMSVLQNNVLEFGAGVVGKEGNAGKIGYRTFTPDSLDIVGAGTTGTDRKVRIHAEGGTMFTGPVGILNAAPQKLLHLGSTALGSEGMIRLQSTSSAGGASRNWDIGVPETDNDTAGVGYSFVIDDTFRAGNDFIVRWDTGNVGLGTITPSAQLSLGGGLANTKLALWDNGPGSSYGLGIQPNQFRLHVNSAADDFVFYNAPAGSEVMRIKGNGNVGIGTGTPGNILQVGGTFHGANGFGLSVNSSQYGANIQINRGPGAIGSALVLDNSGNGDANTSLLFVRNNVALGAQTLLNLRADGNLGVGTFSPQAKLDVNGNIAMGNTHILQARNSGGGLEDVFWPRYSDNITYLNFGSGGFNIRNNASSSKMFIANNGYVGIGTDSPFSTLQINHPLNAANAQDSALRMDTSTGRTLLWMRTFTAGGPFNFELFEGNAFKPGGGSWGAVSDQRLKKDVRNLEGALDSLLRLRSVTFEFKDTAAVRQQPGRHTGFIAQEVEKVFPEWVTPMADGMKAVAPVGFESLTVQALRELRKEKDVQEATLRKEIDELKSEVAALKGKLAKQARVDALQDEVAALKAVVQQLVKGAANLRQAADVDPADAGH